MIRSLWPASLFWNRSRLFLVAGLDQLMNRRGGGGEADREALLAGRQAKTEGDVGLAGA